MLQKDIDIIILKHIIEGTINKYKQSIINYPNLRKEFSESLIRLQKMNYITVVNDDFLGQSIFINQKYEKYWIKQLKNK